MAAITDATTTSSLTELIPAEQIAEVGQSAFPIPIASMVAATVSCGPSNVHRIPYYDSVSVPLSQGAGKSETDEFAATEQTASEASMTASTVGIRYALADEVGVFAGQALDISLVAQQFGAMLEQIDEDTLSNITSAANTSDFSGSDLTIERVGTAVAALRQRNGPGRLALALSEVQLEDLKKSYRSAGLAYGAAMNAQIAANLNAQVRGEVGVHEGMPIFATTVVPAYDGNNDAGAVVRVGDKASESGLALGVWMPVRLERARGANGAVRMHDELVTAAIYSSTLVRDDCIQEIASSNS